MDIIKIENVSFRYDKTNVLEDINLTVKNDDFLAIIGPNGGGKSTFLKLILQILTPNSGNININGKLSDVGYVPQNTNLNIDFPITALEVVLMGHTSSRKSWFGYSKEDKACAMSSLQKVGMEDFANAKIGCLSGGQRQRVFIARALCANPKIMLLDEPTASIDVKGQRDIYELLKTLSKTMAIVVVSHDISVLLNYAKSVAHINKHLVFHSLDNINQGLVKDDEHLCEVELLNALGSTIKCGC